MTESHTLREFQPVDLYDYFSDRDLSSLEWTDDKSQEYSAHKKRLYDPIAPYVCKDRHEIPSLLNKAIFTVSAVLNASSDIPSQIFDQLPSNIIDRIIPQLSFTALRRLFGDRWREFLDLPKYRTLLASIKTEEDVYRFLYYHNASHPQLQHDIILNVLEIRDVLTYGDIPSDEPLICRAHNKGFWNNHHYLSFPRVPDFSVARGEAVITDKATFEHRWKVYTQDMFAHLDWNNVFVAGGSVLHCLRQMKYEDKYDSLEDLFTKFYGESDVDVYIYGLDEEATKAKVLEIYKSVKNVFGKLYVVRSKNALTLFADGMRAVQIIATMYKSVAEILLSFDLGCIMVGYNGSDVVCLPRFLVSMKYMTVHLDSDMNLSNKLQWFRLQKYAVRGFNTALPTAFRFHGLNGFDKEFPSPKSIEHVDVDTSLKKIVEIMSLSKMTLLEKTLPRYWMNFPFLWNLRWHQGFSFNFSRSSLDEKRALENWDVGDVTEEFKNLELEHLTYGHSGSVWFEPPAYPDSLPVWSMDPQYRESSLAADAFKYADGEKASTEEELQQVLQDMEVTPFTESLLQCYYLDAIVKCKTCKKTTKVKDNQSPYRLMNSSLSTIDYMIESSDFELSNLTQSTVGTIESDMLSLGGSYWRVTLEIPKKGDLLWLRLQKLNDVVETEAKKQFKYYFVNFVLTFKNTKEEEEGFNMHFDGSFIFKNEEGLDTWKTFIYRPYIFKPNEFDIDPLDMPHIVGNLVQSDISFLHGSSLLGKLTMQFHAPRLEVVNI